MFKAVEYISPEELRAILDENICQRRKLIESAFLSPDIAFEIKEKCKNNFLFWLEYFCWTFDPRPNAIMPIMPFLPYQFQKEDALELIDAISNGDDRLIEKSRDMGYTWLICYIFQWFWQFHEGANFLIGSRIIDNVDIIGDPACIFEKLRLNIKKQPPFLAPAGFNKELHMPYTRIINPENGNSIIGGTSSPNFGRSGRYKAILMDEFAFWEHAHYAWGASSQSTECRIALSTPFGATNKFAELRFAGTIAIITRHWSSHPRKTDGFIEFEDGTCTSKWYEEQKNKMTEVERGRELDIDYMTSREGAVYKFKRKYHVVSNLKEDICRDKDVIIYRIWDFGLNPACIFKVNTPYGSRTLRELVPTDKPTTKQFAVSVLNYSQSEFDGFKFKDRCDVAGNQTNRQTLKTDIEVLHEAGVYPDTGKVPIEDGISALQALLDSPDGFLIDSKCLITIAAFEGGYYRKEDKSGLNKEMPPEEVHPYEDVMDCERYHNWFHFRPSKFNKKEVKHSKPIYYDDFEI